MFFLCFLNFWLLLLLFYSFEFFSHQRKLVVFHRRLSDSKSPLISRTLLSILVNLNNAVVWMVSIHPLISKLSSLCTNPLVTVPSAPITLISPSLSCSIFSRFSFFCWPSLGLVVWPRFDTPFVSQNPKEFCASHFLGQIQSCAYTIW